MYAALFGVLDAILKVGAKALSQLFSFTTTKKWLIEKTNEWSQKNGIAYSIAWHLQKPLAQSTGGTICGYCEWAVLPGETHESCELTLKADKMSDPEVLAAYEEFGGDTSQAFNAQAETFKQMWARVLENVMHQRGIGSFDTTTMWPTD